MTDPEDSLWWLLLLLELCSAHISINEESNRYSWLQRPRNSKIFESVGFPIFFPRPTYPNLIFGGQRGSLALCLFFSSRLSYFLRHYASASFRAIFDASPNFPSTPTPTPPGSTGQTLAFRCSRRGTKSCEYF